MNGKRIILMGNEAIARGALEGGVSYSTGYPGNPSSEIIETMFSFKEKHEISVEWSVNEIVALEAAAAFSFTGLHAMVAMKQNGINVCSDFLTTVALDDLKGGLLLVVCDDPGPLTSSNEEDSRHFAKIAQVPLLEPSTPQEAKEMAKWLLNFSKQMGIPCILRSVSRLSHGRSGVTLDSIERPKVEPFFDRDKPLVGLPHLVTINHSKLLQKMKKVEQIFEQSTFNQYEGPADARFIIMTTGLGFLYAREAVETLSLTDTVGILKIGTTWPLPAGLLQKYLKQADEVLFVEEIDPFLEDQVKVLYAETNGEMGTVKFYGKKSGDVQGPGGPGVGEINGDVVLDALTKILQLERPWSKDYAQKAVAYAEKMLVPRELSFCQGCPHRASFLAIKVALDLDGRQGFVVGDIGCYGLAAGATGFNQIKALHCMGSGMGNASGFSKLKSFGFNQPAVAVAGDSTFYHSCIPALVNAQANKADALFVVLDNSVTAMTGFQLNPASCGVAASDLINPIPVEELTRGLGIKTAVLDPVEDIGQAKEAVYNFLQEDGVKVIVFRHVCATFKNKKIKDGQRASARVDQEKCLGEQCGCDRFCIRIINCPAIQYDSPKAKAYIEEDICNGCSLCLQLCPRKAIMLVDTATGEVVK